MKLAVATNANATDVIDLLSKTLRAYNLSASDAATTAAKLNGIVERGLTTVQELSQGFAQVATVAKQSGVSIDDLAASLAILTSKGISTPEALTNLRSLALQLTDPAFNQTLTDLNAKFKDTALQVTAASIQSDGLAVTLDKVSQAVGGSTDAFRQLFPDVTSLGAALPLIEDAVGAVGDAAKKSGDDVVVFKSKLQQFTSEIQDMSAIKLDELFGNKLSTDTLLQFKQIVNQITETFIELGRVLQPILLDSLGTLKEYVTNLGNFARNNKEAVKLMVEFNIHLKAIQVSLSVVINTAKTLFGLYTTWRLISFKLFKDIGALFITTQEAAKVTGFWAQMQSNLNNFMQNSAIINAKNLTGYEKLGLALRQLTGIRALDNDQMKKAVGLTVASTAAQADKTVVDLAQINAYNRFVLVKALNTKATWGMSAALAAESAIMTKQNALITLAIATQEAEIATKAKDLLATMGINAANATAVQLETARLAIKRELLAAHTAEIVAIETQTKAMLIQSVGVNKLTFAWGTLHGSIALAGKALKEFVGTMAAFLLANPIIAVLAAVAAAAIGVYKAIQKNKNELVDFIIPLEKVNISLAEQSKKTQELNIQLLENLAIKNNQSALDKELIANTELQERVQGALLITSAKLTNATKELDEANKKVIKSGNGLQEFFRGIGEVIKYLWSVFSQFLATVVEFGKFLLGGFLNESNRAKMVNYFQTLGDNITRSTKTLEESKAAWEEMTEKTQPKFIASLRKVGWETYEVTRALGELNKGIVAINGVDLTDLNQNFTSNMLTNSETLKTITGNLQAAARNQLENAKATAANLEIKKEAINKDIEKNFGSLENYQKQLLLSQQGLSDVFQRNRGVEIAGSLAELEIRVKDSNEAVALAERAVKTVNALAEQRAKLNKAAKENEGADLAKNLNRQLENTKKDLWAALDEYTKAINMKEADLLNKPEDYIASTYQKTVDALDQSLSILSASVDMNLSNPIERANQILELLNGGVKEANGGIMALKTILDPETFAIYVKEYMDALDKSYEFQKNIVNSESNLYQSLQSNRVTYQADGNKKIRALQKQEMELQIRQAQDQLNILEQLNADPEILKIRKAEIATLQSDLNTLTLQQLDEYLKDYEETLRKSQKKLELERKANRDKRTLDEIEGLKLEEEIIGKVYLEKKKALDFELKLAKENKGDVLAIENELAEVTFQLEKDKTELFKQELDLRIKALQEASDKEVGNLDIIKAKYDEINASLTIQQDISSQLTAMTTAANDYRASLLETGKNRTESLTKQRELEKEIIALERENLERKVAMEEKALEFKKQGLAIEMKMLEIQTKKEVIDAKLNAVQAGADLQTTLKNPEATKEEKDLAATQLALALENLNASMQSLELVGTQRKIKENELAIEGQNIKDNATIDRFGLDVRAAENTPTKADDRTVTRNIIREGQKEKPLPESVKEIEVPQLKTFEENIAEVFSTFPEELQKVLNDNNIIKAISEYQTKKTEEVAEGVGSYADGSSIMPDGTYVPPTPDLGRSRSASLEKQEIDNMYNQLKAQNSSLLLPRGDAQSSTDLSSKSLDQGLFTLQSSIFSLKSTVERNAPLPKVEISQARSLGSSMNSNMESVNINRANESKESQILEEILKLATTYTTSPKESKEVKILEDILKLAVENVKPSSSLKQDTPSISPNITVYADSTKGVNQASEVGRIVREELDKVFNSIKL
jgi:hypothetical protein